MSDTNHADCGLCCCRWDFDKDTSAPQRVDRECRIHGERVSKPRSEYTDLISHLAAACVDTSTEPARLVLLDHQVSVVLRHHRETILDALGDKLGELLDDTAETLNFRAEYGKSRELIGYSLVRKLDAYAKRAILSDLENAVGELTTALLSERSYMRTTGVLPGEM